MSDASGLENALSAVQVERKPLEVLLEEHRQVCWGFLMARMGGHHADAQDALQETWIRAYKAWPRYREQGEFRAWLLRIARREAIRLQRKNRKRPEESPFWEGKPALTPDDASEQKDEVRQIHLAIESLPPHQREAVWLRLLEECGFREIARIQGVPEGTAVTRVRRGLDHLQQRLSGESP